MISLPRGKLLFDTSVYIRHIRDRRFPWVSEDRDVVERSILTVVVVAELQAGARYPEEKKSLEELWRGHETLGTLSTPDKGSWLLAGQLLASYVRLHGTLRMADHFRDVLIGLEAAKNQATLLTENARDFLRWQKLFESAGLALAVFDTRRLPS